jgi:hypothetical protein
VQFNGFLAGNNNRSSSITRLNVSYQIPDALPAVTTPASLIKTGFSLAKVSDVVSGRGCSSTLNSSMPFRVLISTGAISA